MYLWSSPSILIHFLREKDKKKTAKAHHQFHKREHFEDASQFLLYLLGFSQEGHL